MKPRIPLFLLAAWVSLIGCGEEPTYQGKPLSEWKRLMDDRDIDTRLEAALAVVKLDREDSVARQICAEWTEKELLPLAMKTAIKTGTFDGIERDQAIAKVIPTDPWGQPIRSGGCTGDAPMVKTYGLPANEEGYSFVQSAGPDGDNYADSDNLILFWDDDTGQKFSRVPTALLKK